MVVENAQDEFADVGEPLFEQRERITVAKYHRMITARIYDENSRVELIEGIIVAKMPKSEAHVCCSTLIQFILMPLVLPRNVFLSIGNPLMIVERDSEPEPDAQIIRGHPRDYARCHCAAREAKLVIEISDMSYRMDRYRKWTTYASARVPIYWIADLNKNRLEVHTDPVGSGYDTRYGATQFLSPDDEVPLILDGREVARFPVREILP